jgi:hypothetical protein
VYEDHCDPSKLRCHEYDLVAFMNRTHLRHVRVQYDASPFIGGNPPETIVVGAVPVIRQVVGPIGMYTSETQIPGPNGPPDGPAVIVP